MPRPAAALTAQETESLQFVRKYPEYDGRGVTVAVLDTGVDPSAAGLQWTADGRAKIAGLVDCSGSGDVDVTTPAEVFEEDAGLRTRGLSGRTLRFPRKWRNRDGRWFLGLKRGYELFPESLVARLRKRRLEAFGEQHSALLAHVQQHIHLFREEHKDEGRVAGVEQEQRQNLEAQLEALKELMCGYDDPGPVFDCLVWHDGRHWRAVVDTDEDGDLMRMACGWGGCLRV